MNFKKWEEKELNAGRLKKILACMLMGTRCISSLAACGSGQEKEEKNKKESADSNKLVMAWWGNQVRNEKTQAALDKYHEMNEKITVEGQFYQWNDYWSKMATAAAGKRGH